MKIRASLWIISHFIMTCSSLSLIFLSLIHTELILIPGTLLLFAAFAWYAFSYMCLTVTYIGIVLFYPSFDSCSLNWFTFPDMRKMFGHRLIILSWFFFFCNLITHKLKMHTHLFSYMVFGFFSECVFSFWFSLKVYSLS